MEKTILFIQATNNMFGSNQWILWIIGSVSIITTLIKIIDHMIQNRKLIIKYISICHRCKINYIPFNKSLEKNHRIMTIHLISRLKNIRNNPSMRCHDYDVFVDSIPISANYCTSVQKVRETKILSVCQLSDTHCQTTLSIREHCELYDLNNKCEIRLSKQQSDRLWELEHWNIYH